MHPGGDSQISWTYEQFHGLADNFIDFDVSPEHRMTIETKTLLIFGDRDEAFPVEFALEMYRALPNAALWVVPGQGHLVLWESEEARAILPSVVHKFFGEGQG